MTDGGRRAAGVTGFLVVVGLVVAGFVLNEGLAGTPGLTHPESPRELRYFAVMLTIACIALVLVLARPRNSVGWLLGLSPLLGALCEAGQVYGARALVVEGSTLPFGAHVLALSSSLWLHTLFVPATLLLARYPTGALQPGRALLVDRVIRVGMVAMFVGYSTMPEAVTDEVRGGVNPLELPGPVRASFLLVGVLGMLGGAVVVAVLSVRRLLRARYPERQQLTLLLTTSVTAICLVFFSPTEWLAVLSFTLMPVAVALGVFRYRLLGIEIVLRRALLYGALTGLVLVVFVAVTSLLTSVADGRAAEIAAAATVALVVVPARDRLQRVVDRLVYGDRRDPLRALDRLGRGDDLDSVLRAVTESLRLPAAEIVVDDRVLAAVGEVPAGAAEVPMGDGVLRVAHRSGERSLGVADERLLATIAPLLGLVVRSTRLAEQVQVEQQRTAQATEAERARLRRDLHDGLGPSLTGVGLGLEAVDSDALPDRQRAVVRRLREEVAASLEEVRRIIDDLRPGALETGDLLTLVRARAEQITATTPVRVVVEAPEALPPLSPEVEAAALRILDEALTNVVRHSGATTCVVTATHDERLRLEVRDDGIGFTGPRQGGVGLTSMRSRAAAVGGSLELVGGAGTTLTAQL